MSGDIGHGRQCDTFTVETQQHLDRGYTALQCDQCEATWVGPEGESCDWCQTALDNMRKWQAQLVLHPPEHDQDDRQRPAALQAWQQRLSVAIAAKLITREHAARAWDRATATTEGQ